MKFMPFEMKIETFYLPQETMALYPMLDNMGHSAS